MYALDTELFVHEDYRNFPDAEARVERVAGAMGRQPRVYGDRDIPDLLTERPWGEYRQHRYGEQPNVPDPDIVLVCSHWEADDQRAARLEELPAEQRHLARWLMGGYGATWFASMQADYRKPRRDHVCRPAWRLHTMNGCPHRCAYCSLSAVHFAMVNLEDYAAHLKMLIDNNPWETVYLFNDGSDTLVLEPEIDNVRFFIDFFKQWPDRYFVIHTKSANVDFMLDYDHDRRAIVLCSVATPSAATRFEPGAPGMEERYAALRKCYASGYPVRIKFKPIIPMKDWREEAATMARGALTDMRPELINLFTLSWMTFEQMAGAFDLEALDPEIVAAAEAARDDMAAIHVKPLPHDVRRMIYEHFIDEIRKIDADVPITLSTETLEMWQELGPRLGYNARDYICGCGARAKPGLTRLQESPWAVCKPVTWDGEPVPCG